MRSKEISGDDDLKMQIKLAPIIRILMRLLDSIRRPSRLRASRRHLHAFSSRRRCLRLVRRSCFLWRVPFDLAALSPTTLLRSRRVEASSSYQLVVADANVGHLGDIFFGPCIGFQTKHHKDITYAVLFYSQSHVERHPNGMDQPPPCNYLSKS